MDRQVTDLLSEQDRRILALVAEGLTSAQIGERLGLTTGTVGTYRCRIGKVLGTHSPAATLREARWLGLLPQCEARRRAN